jgi:hypothetical protein
MKHIKPYGSFIINEGIKSDIKQYIKKNTDVLNDMADDDMWDDIYQMLYTEFDVDPGSDKAKDIKQTFEFLF